LSTPSRRRPSLRPQAASRVLNANIAEFADNNFALADIFGQSEVGLLQEMLAEAKHSADQIARLEAFLLRHLRQLPVSIFGHACSLRWNPSQSVQQLAQRFNISRRQLSRG
jgi:hypothetical protein